MDVAKTALDPVAGLAAALRVAGEVRPPVGGFPYLAEALKAAGFEHIRYTVAAGVMLYRGAAGAVVDQAAPPLGTAQRVPAWDSTALVTAIRDDQAGHSDFPTFSAACWAAGVVDYEIDLAARTCNYRGADPNNHYVENYPAITLPPH